MGREDSSQHYFFANYLSQPPPKYGCMLEVVRHSKNLHEKGPKTLRFKGLFHG